MCFHNSLSVDAQTLQNRYRVSVELTPKFSPVYHASAFSNPGWPVLTNENTNSFRILQWGLIPHWVKDKEKAMQMRAGNYNGRAETVLQKSSFADSFKQRRCLVPSTGFFEWQHIDNQKIPWYIKLKDEEIFSFAGLWDEWTDQITRENISSFTILTTSANELMEKIHNTKKRMPVILNKQHEQMWLNSQTNVNQLNELLIPFQNDKMTSWTVGKIISSKSADTNVPEVQKEYLYTYQKKIF